MLFCLTKLLKIASNKSLIEIGAEELETYLGLGFRREIVSGINFKGLLRDLIGSGEESYDESQALMIIDGAIYKFISGKTLNLTRNNDPDEAAEDVETDLRELNVTERLWKQGKGAATEARLRAELTDMIVSKRMVPYSEVPTTLNKILLKETGTLSGEAAEIFSRIKPNISRILYADILNTLRSEKFNISTKLKRFSPVENLEEPQEGKRVEKIDPAFQNLHIPIEEISKWVEKWMGKKYHIVYENLISSKPLSEESLVDKIEKETGTKVDRRTINNWKSDLVKGVKEKFFESVPQRKTPESIGGTIMGMSDEDFKEFEEFVADKIEGKEETRGKSQTEESVESLKRYVKELKTRGNDLNAIARDLNINISTIKAWNYRKVLPWYEEWQKEKKRNKKAVVKFMERLITAMRNTIDYDNIGAVTMVKEIDYDDIIAGPAVAAYEKWALDYDQIGMKVAFRYPEKVLEEISTKEVTEKKEALEKFQKAFTKSFLNPIPRRYDIVIEFKADFDWTDIAKGKFSPQLDANGKWIKDEPAFAWESYKVHIDHTLSTKHYQYSFTQKVKPDGSNAGEPESFLDVTNSKGEQVIHESGSGGFYKKFIDEHFGKIKGLGMPPPKGAEFRVEYRNMKLHREYNSTHEFEDEYGGLAVSDLAHADRAKQYAEFQRKMHEKHYGPGRTVTPEMSLGEAQAILKKNLKKNLPEKIKSQIREFQAMIENLKDMKELPLQKRLKLDRFIESLYSTENEGLQNVSVFEQLPPMPSTAPKKKDR